jgi:predicted enzyme related to lactoylglutathione lyase
MIRPITTTLIQTPEFERVKAFYTALLNVKFHLRASGTAIAVLGDTVYIIAESLEPRMTTKVFFAVDDPATREQALRALGGETTSRRGELPMGETVIVADPDGQPVELVQLSADALALLAGKYDGARRMGEQPGPWEGA